MIIVLITGSRDWNDEKTIKEAILELHEKYSEKKILIHGGCRGTDSIGAKIASSLGWTTIAELPDWSLGRKAGPLRNQKMIDKYKPKIALIFNKNNSKGTTDCKNRLLRMDTECEIIEYTITE